MTMTSFAITLHGQCCRRHVVEQQVVSNISVLRSRWSISSLCNESNNTNLLLSLLTAVLGTSILLHITNITWPTAWRRVPGDHNLATSLYLIYNPSLESWYELRAGHLVGSTYMYMFDVPV